MKYLAFSLFFLILPCLSGAGAAMNQASEAVSLIETSTAVHVYQRLRQYVTEYADGHGGSHLSIDVLQSERWQALPECPALPDIQFSEVTSTGKLTLNVSCPGQGMESGWKHRLLSKIDFQVPVYITTVDLKKGETLNRLKQVQRSAFSSAFASGRSALTSGDIAQGDVVQEYVALRPLKTGTLITSDIVKKPLVVHRGAAVTIIARSASVVITTPGNALESGRVGDIVQVKRDNGRMISCQILNANEVRPVASHGKKLTKG